MEEKETLNLARRAPREKKENSFWDFVKFLFIVLVVVVPIRIFVAQPFIVSGHSMDPTFSDGQYLIVDELSYRLREPNRGDVVIFRPPLEKSKYYIKRIIGLPGEIVKINGSNITITRTDGSTETLVEPYIKNESKDVANSWNLKSDEYFMMGDNRPFSSDSRAWGPVQKDLLIGRAFLRIFPVAEAGILPGKYRK